MRHWEKLSKPELIQACKDKGFDTRGDTGKLIARLRGKPEPPAEPAAAADQPAEPTEPETEPTEPTE